MEGFKSEKQKKEEKKNLIVKIAAITLAIIVLGIFAFMRFGSNKAGSTDSTMADYHFENETTVDSTETTAKEIEIKEYNRDTGFGKLIPLTPVSE